jgi:RNA polymerase sigma-70 factor, ECF subfamily
MTARLQPDTWDAVMSQVAKRNEAALAQLYDGTSKIVYAMALRVVRDPSAAEDITIDVYLQVWRNAASYDPTRGEAVPWLATLTRSRAIDHLRARKARRAEFEDSVDEIVDLRDSRPSPELECMAARQARLCEQPLATCPRSNESRSNSPTFRGLAIPKSRLAPACHSERSRPEYGSG